MAEKTKYETEIIRGAQYQVPIIIKQGDTVITDQNADGVKVCFDTAVASYPGGGLTYSEGVWLFPLTQELSLAMESGEVDFQIQVKIGDTVIPTKIKKIKVDDTAIKGVW